MPSPTITSTSPQGSRRGTDRQVGIRAASLRLSQAIRHVKKDVRAGVVLCGQVWDTSTQGITGRNRVDPGLNRVYQE